MQLEVGKFYKSRNGYKAKVIGKNTKGDIFVIETEEEGIFIDNMWRTTTSGRLLDSAQHKHDYDLIEEWVEQAMSELDKLLSDDGCSCRCSQRGGKLAKICQEYTGFVELLIGHEGCNEEVKIAAKNLRGSAEKIAGDK